MVSIIHPRPDVQALYGQTELLIQELTDWADPLPEDKLVRIQKIAQEVIRDVKGVLCGGWDIRGNIGEERRLQGYLSSLVRVYPFRLNPYPREYRFFSDANPMDATTRDLLITKRHVAAAVRGLHRLRDQIPTAALVSLPSESGCCAVQ